MIREGRIRELERLLGRLGALIRPGRHAATAQLQLHTRHRFLRRRLTITTARFPGPVAETAHGHSPEVDQGDVVCCVSC